MNLRNGPPKPTRLLACSRARTRYKALNLGRLGTFHILWYNAPLRPKYSRFRGCLWDGQN